MTTKTLFTSVIKIYIYLMVIIACLWQLIEYFNAGFGKEVMTTVFFLVGLGGLSIYLAILCFDEIRILHTYLLKRQKGTATNRSRKYNPAVIN